MAADLGAASDYRQDANMMTGQLSVVAAIGLVLAMAGCGASDSAKVEPENQAGVEKIFELEAIPVIQLTPSGGWATLVTAYVEQGKNEYVESGFDFNEDHLDSIGLRIREEVEEGEGRDRTKYNLKINFDYFDGKRFNKTDQLLLAVDRPDPSMMREALTARLFEAMGVPSPRVDYARVSADGNELGLYVMKQVVDKRFLKDRFGTADHADDGNLYECVPPGCLLEWAGDTKDSYLDTSCGEDGGCGLVLITNEDDPSDNDYSDLITLLNVIGTVPDEQFADAIKVVFDVDTFLRYLAVAVVIGDHESYLGAGQDFYLYHRPDTGLFTYIPWDHNRTYGAKKCKTSTEETGVEVDKLWCDTAPRPLTTRILAVGEFNESYLAYVKQVRDEFFTETVQGQWVDELDARFGELLEADGNRGFTMDEYWTSISRQPSEDKPSNLLHFVKTRRAYLMAELP